MFTTNKEIVLLIVSYVLIIILVLFVFIFLIQISKRRKLKFQAQLEIEQQKLLQTKLENELAILTERERIVADLHDDLGTGLTSIKMLSELALLKDKNLSQAELKKIKHNADSLVQSLSEIVWAMNPKHNESFITYILNYATDYCKENDLELNFTVAEATRHIAIEGLVRRNLFLVIKETLHNTFKHADATKIELHFALQNEQLTIVIHDNGKGIDLNNLRAFGNGLMNMQARMNTMSGSYLIVNDNGTVSTLILPYNT